MNKFVDYLILTVGSVIVAFGLELILAPNNLVDGGVTALSIMANAVWGIPIWGGIIGLNLPIISLVARDMGKRFVIRTVYANIVTSIALIWFKPMAAITSSEVLIVIYGGFFLGLGVGLVVKAGGAIDGTEMIAVWINRHYHIPISTFLLSLNAIILTISGFVFTLEKALFSIAVFFLVAKTIELVLNGLVQAVSVMIISDKSREIGTKLMETLEVRLTYLQAKGGFTGEPKEMIYCITDRFLYPKLRELVLEIDERAILEASFVTETAGVKQSNFFESFQKTKNRKITTLLSEETLKNDD